MSFDHRTIGWEQYEAFIAGLKAAGTDVTEALTDEVLIRGDALTGEPQALRIATFTRGDKTLVVEEYLACDDGDCDGTSHVRIVTYEKGQRPKLYRDIYDGGRLSYPTMPRTANGLPDLVRLYLDSGKFEIIEADEPEAIGT